MRRDERCPPEEARGGLQMRWRNSDTSWGWPARWLHWGMAVLIPLTMGLGWLAAGWRLSPTKLDLFVWHKSLGLSLLALTVVRLLWRWSQPVPRLPRETPSWQRRAAAANQLALYLLMLLMPLSGWVINSAANVPFKWFWWLPVPELVGPDPGLRDRAQWVHLTLFWLFSGLLVVHLGAALHHHWGRRDGVLDRMLGH